MALLTSKDTSGDDEMAFDFHFPSSKSALLIFTRNPELGKVKSRLAKTVGDESALEIYKFLLQHTVKITSNLNVDKFVFYSEKIRKEDIWDEDIFRKKIQKGEDLGERMQNAFSEAFEMGYEKAIIIGSDMFDLDAKDIEKAFNTLHDTKYVLGPATDGGYYLLGMKELKKEIFTNKIWGTDTVLKSTLEDLKEEKYVLLEARNDVDYYEDIKDIDAFQKFFPTNLNKNLQ